MACLLYWTAQSYGSDFRDDSTPWPYEFHTATGHEVGEEPWGGPPPAARARPMVATASRTRVWLAILIPLWYAASALCNVNSKVVLRNAQKEELHCPLSVTAMQFVFTTFVGALFCIALGRRPPPRVVLYELCLVSGSYTMGFLLLNSSLGKLAAAFSETVSSHVTADVESSQRPVS